MAINSEPTNPGQQEEEQKTFKPQILSLQPLQAIHLQTTTPATPTIKTAQPQLQLETQAQNPAMYIASSIPSTLGAELEAGTSIVGKMYRAKAEKSVMFTITGPAGVV